MYRPRKLIALSASADKLPTEFRLFAAGWNDTEKGKYLFDDKAAASVMLAYREWGVDVMIDLEHQTLDVEPGAADPTARDARGWCELAVRNGELWAVNVRWTPDGQQRLTQKRQRYISPVFAHSKSGRVLKILNIALVAMPATHDTPALVAASIRQRIPMLTKLRTMVMLAISMGGDAYLAKQAVALSTGSGLDPAVVKQALEAIEKGDPKAALDILKGLIASAAGAEPDGDEGDGGEGDGAEGITQADEATTMGTEAPKVVPAGAAPDAPADDEGEEDEGDPKKKAARKAMSRLLLRETGTTSLAEALNKVLDFKASHLTLELGQQKLAADRAVLESSERRKLCGELVTLGAQIPATVWADPLSKSLKPKGFWASMPIADLRAHVAEHKAARGSKQKTPATTVQPAHESATTDGVDLTADEQKEVGALSADLRAIVEKFDAMDWQIHRNTPNASLSNYAQLKSRRDRALANGKRP